MDKERETGDGTLDRFSHYPYAPTITVQSQQPTSGHRNLPPIITNNSDTGLDTSQPLTTSSNVLKRNQLNLSATAYAYPPGFVDLPVNEQSEDIHNVIKQTLMNNGKTAASAGSPDPMPPASE